MSIRFAAIEDAPSILSIYSQYIDTPITFEEELPSLALFEARMESILFSYPFFVWEEKGQIKGYAYAHAYHERSAYQWGAELSVYLDQDTVSKGVGRLLYTALIKELKKQNIKTVYGCVVVPNEKSEALHYSLGFRRIGTFQSAGYKCGKWRNVSWYEKEIASYSLTPAPFIPYSLLSSL